LSNFLLEKFIDLLSSEPRGKVLDIGCGDGDYALALHQLGFDVLAADMDEARFKYKDKIKFQKCNVAEKLPFKDGSFKYIVLAEVVEHLKNPYEVMGELKRILKPGGKLILSTPNILNLKSRMRYLVEGCWEYFREPLIENSKNPRMVIWNLHVIPWRYHELEYLLYHSGLAIETIATSRHRGLGLCFLIPLIKLQLYLKARRARSKGNVDYMRINKILSSKDMLFGEHLVIKAVKKMV